MKSSVKILVDNIGSITEFVRAMSNFTGEAKLIKGKYKCDAKSLMGLLAIDTSTPTIVEFDIADKEELLSIISKYIIE